MTDLSRIICHLSMGQHQKICQKRVQKSKFSKKRMICQKVTLGSKMSLEGVKIPNSLILMRSGADDASNHIIEQFYDPHMTSHAYILR